MCKCFLWDKLVQVNLISQYSVKDGDAKLSLNIPSLSSGNTASFTIDVDDTLAVSELGKIRISDSEIKNGRVSLQSEKQALASAIFGNDSKAVIKLKACPS